MYEINWKETNWIIMSYATLQDILASLGQNILKVKHVVLLLCIIHLELKSGRIAMELDIPKQSIWCIYRGPPAVSDQ